MEKFPNSKPESEVNGSKSELKIPASVLSEFEEFWLKNGREIRETVDPLVEKFTNNNAETVISLLVENDGANNRHAAYYMYEYLSKALDIDTKIKFIDSSSSLYESIKGGAEYDPYDDVVLIKIKDGLEQFDIKDTEFLGGRLCSIAHEMFHGYQTKISKTDNPRADLYSKNDYHCTSSGLASSEQELAKYFCQPIEAEAYYFERQISHKLAQALEKIK